MFEEIFSLLTDSSSNPIVRSACLQSIAQLSTDESFLIFLLQNPTNLNELFSLLLSSSTCQSDQTNILISLINLTNNSTISNYSFPFIHQFLFNEILFTKNNNNSSYLSMLLANLSKSNPTQLLNHHLSNLNLLFKKYIQIEQFKNAFDHLGIVFVELFKHSFSITSFDSLFIISLLQQIPICSKEGVRRWSNATIFKHFSFHLSVDNFYFIEKDEFLISIVDCLKGGVDDLEIEKILLEGLLMVTCKMREGRDLLRRRAGSLNENGLIYECLRDYEPKLEGGSESHDLVHRIVDFILREEE